MSFLLLLFFVTEPVHLNDLTLNMSGTSKESFLFKDFWKNMMRVFLKKPCIIYKQRIQDIFTDKK